MERAGSSRIPAPLTATAGWEKNRPHPGRGAAARTPARSRFPGLRGKALPHIPSREQPLERSRRLPGRGCPPLFGRRSGGCSPGPCARLAGRGRPVGRGERSEVQERSCGTQGRSRGMRGEVRDAGRGAGCRNDPVGCRNGPEGCRREPCRSSAAQGHPGTRGEGTATPERTLARAGMRRRDRGGIGAGSAPVGHVSLLPPPLEGG